MNGLQCPVQTCDLINFLALKYKNGKVPLYKAERLQIKDGGNYIILLEYVTMLMAMSPFLPRILWGMLLETDANF